jgi:Na+-translocating ferredoxin:NAD+ oxidoreductase RnfG subunit
MKKHLINIAFFACVAVAIYAIRIHLIQDFADKQIKRSEQKQQEFKELSKQRLEQDRETAEQKRLDEPVKVLVRAKDVRACMSDLATDTLNNEVVECTKDHYITVKRRDVEK